MNARTAEKKKNSEFYCAEFRVKSTTSENKTDYQS